ncbi:MAG TPA: asparaginase [Ilumatobacteraceae bacterium]
MPTPESFAPVAITRRSGFDESVHFGAVVGLASNGDIAFAVGDPASSIYPRSSNKPMQALAMVRAGLDLPDELLALVCASHDGTPVHLAAARRILALADLDETMLANTADLPLDEESAGAVLRAGGGPTPLQMNCSGKHSGMLLTSAINRWPVDASYLSHDHPLQQRITATIDEITGEEHAHIGVDGCGSPAHVISLVALARGFRSIATGAAGQPGDAVYRAMTTHPEMVGGHDRDVTHFMRNVRGLMAKDGADGVFAAALPDGRAVALKIADGANRARPPVMVAALRALGIDTSVVEPMVRQWILGHGSHVGEVTAIAP